MRKIFVIALFVLVVKHERDGGIIDNVDALHNVIRQWGIFYVCGFERMVLGVGDGNKEIVLETFFCAVGTADDDTDFGYRCFARPKPLPYGW